MDMKIDSARIRAEREQRAWSQEQLAVVSGLGQRTVQRIESTGTASLESVKALAAAFDLTVADLRVENGRSPAAWRFEISFELPVRLLLAAASGVVAGLFLENSLGSPWLDYAVSAAVFAAAVLWPYLRKGRGLAWRALALVGASALSYGTAVELGEYAEGAMPSGPWDPGVGAVLLASFVGAAVVLIAARFVVPLRVTARYWAFGAVAAVVGAAAMYAGLDGFNTLGFMLGSAAWQMCVCLALFAGRRANDGEDQLFSRAISRWGRLTLSREARTQNFLVNPTLTT